MSTTTAITIRKGLALLFVGVVLTSAIGVSLLSHESLPDDWGTVILGAASVGILASLFLGWRVFLKGADISAFERALTARETMDDERGDAVLTRSLAVVGLTSIPLTGAAGISIALGLPVILILIALMAAHVLTGIIAFSATVHRG